MAWAASAGTATRIMRPSCDNQRPSLKKAMLWSPRPPPRPARPPPATIYPERTSESFLQQRHRQTPRHLGVLFLHRTWSCAPFDKISMGRATTRILSLCFSLFQYRQSSEAKRLVLSYGFFFLFLGRFVLSFLPLSGISLISIFGRTTTASSVFLDNPRNHQGWFQGGHLLGASIS